MGGVKRETIKERGIGGTEIGKIQEMKKDKGRLSRSVCGNQ